MNLPLVLPLVQVVLGELLRVLVVDVLLALSSFALFAEHDGLVVLDNVNLSFAVVASLRQLLGI